MGIVRALAVAGAFLVAILALGACDNPILHSIPVFSPPLQTTQVATPSFSPSPQTYPTDQMVAISDTTSGATIYYTTDGSLPTTSSLQYAGAIAVAGDGTTTTIKAIAVESGMADSQPAIGTYIIQYPQVAMPSFSPSPQTYSSDQMVTVSDTTAGATIYYTTDGTTPTTSSTPYAGQIAVAGDGTTVTINAFAVASGKADSQVAIGTYGIQYKPPVATPAFSPNGGSVTPATPVMITDGTGGATVYCATANSSTPPSVPNPPPAAPWSLCMAPLVPVGADQSQWIVVAQATASAYSDSAVATSLVYTITLPAPTNVSVGAATTTSLQVSWSTMGGATGYNIFRDTSASMSSATEVVSALSSATTSYTDSTALSGITYYYAVQATYAGGANPLSYSTPVSGTTIPAAPTGLTVSSATSTSLTLNWNATTGASSYNLYRAPAAGGPFIQVSPGPVGATTTYPDSSLTQNTQYYYEIEAVGSSGNSVFSAVIFGTTLPPSVYAGGYSTNATGVIFAGYWKDGTWVGLTNIYGSYEAEINALAVSGTNVVYAGGYSKDSSTVIHAGYWSNGTWVELASTAAVSSLAVSATNVVYSGGYSGSPGGASYWTNTAWTGLTNGEVAGDKARVTAIAVSAAPTVYSGGFVDNDSGNQFACTWTNGSYARLTNPYSTVTPPVDYDAAVNCLFLSGTSLYAGGYVNNSLVNVAGYWLDGSWTGLVNPYGAHSAAINSLVVDAGGHVYAAGFCKTASGLFVPGYWLDGTWNGLVNPNGAYDASVRYLVLFGPDVYAGGYGKDSSGIFTAGYWKNGTWAGLTNPYGAHHAQVSSLVVQ